MTCLLTAATFVLVAFQSVPESAPSRPSADAQTRPASPADARMQVAERAYQLRDYKRAETELLAAKALEPERVDVYVRLGIVQYRLQHWTDAVATIEKALQLKPDLIGELQVLGHCQYELGNLDKALEAYGKALAVNPNNREALRGKGVTLERLARYDEAEDALRKAIALNPDAVPFLLPLGRVLVRKKQYGSALPYLEKAKKLDPFDWEVEYELGRIYKALGDDVKAKAAFERKEFLRNQQEAIRSLKTRFLGDPRDLTAIVQLATRYDILGDTVNAEQAWGRAVNLSRDNVAVAAARAISFVITGNKAAAEKHLRDRIVKHPNEPESWEILWFVLRERGDVKGTEDAAMRFRNLTKRDPVAPELPRLDSQDTPGPVESSPASAPVKGDERVK